MREIKFRAVYKGELLDRVFLPFDLYDELTRPINVNHEGTFERQGLLFEQFTGLRDKNGKEIYEGDIVKISRFNGDSIIHGSIFEEKGAFRVENGYDIADTNYIGAFKSGIVEVLGNIHESPELLPRNV